MRVLIDILHPAHVHVFRAVAAELENRGHVVTFTARDKDVTLDLLDAYGLSAHVLSRQRTGVAGLAWEMLTRTSSLYKMLRKERPDLLLGIMGPSIAVAGRLLGVPAVVMYDTEIASITNRWVYPLASRVLTPDSYEGHVSGTHVTYPSYHELAYLHPDRFKADPEALTHFGVTAGEPYSVMRFVSWQASHDIKDKGIDLESRLKLVRALQAQGRVLISSEGPLPTELRPHAMEGPVHLVHHLLAHADLFVGESATMASEAAVLGTPAIYMANQTRGYLNDLARRGLVQVFGAADTEAAMDLIQQGWTRDVASSSRHRAMLSERMDATTWIVDWLEREFS